MKQTKIICTISDLRSDEESIRKLFNSGMNVVRINTAHAGREGMEQIIRNARSVSPHLGILIDTKGPEVRTTQVRQPVVYKKGDIVKIFGRSDMESTHDVLNLSYVDIARDVHKGNHLLIDDGALDMMVLEVQGPMVVARVQNDGVLGSHKSVNIPGTHIDLPAVTAKDKENILFAIGKDIDFIAHSFVRNAADVKSIQDILDEHNSEIKIISKIENQEGVDNIDEIIDASYGIMVARGDLGIEVPMEKIPGIQRMIIRKCIEKKKPVIVATQMLQSMIANPRPTRAEVTDIANAIYMRTDALMLSGETTIGQYPVEAVRTMRSIAVQAEQDNRMGEDFEPSKQKFQDRREFLCYCAIKASEKIGVKAIITDSETGLTARNLAAFRGPTPILAICYKEKTQRWLNLSYGIITVYQREQTSPDFIFKASVRMLRQKGYITNEDKIAYLSGSFGVGGGTSFMEISKVSDIFNAKNKYHLPGKIDENV